MAERTRWLSDRQVLRVGALLLALALVVLGAVLVRQGTGMTREAGSGSPGGCTISTDGSGVEHRNPPGCTVPTSEVTPAGDGLQVLGWLAVVLAVALAIYQGFRWSRRVVGDWLPAK